MTCCVRGNVTESLDRPLCLPYDAAMKPTTTLPVRDRIMATASDLFYRQGYRATGINQVIAESGVAKASFYDHFPSKDDLLLAYAKATSERELADMRREVQALPTPRKRFFGPLTILVPWFESSDYRGCPFQNMIAEIPADNWRVRDVAREHREQTRALLRDLTGDLAASDPRLTGVNVDDVADTYLLLFEGAIAMSVVYRQPWPVKQAIRAMEIRVKGP